MPGLIFTLWLAVALVAYDSYKAGELPMPKRFTWIAVVWSALGLVAVGVSPQIATLLAVGLVLAMAYHYLNTSVTVTDENSPHPTNNPTPKAA